MLRVQGLRDSRAKFEEWGFTVKELRREATHLFRRTLYGVKPPDKIFTLLSNI